MILGVDPGGRWWGWALLAGGAYVEAGVLDLSELGEQVVLAGLRKIAARADGIAIERPGGVHPGIIRSEPARAAKASADLSRAAWVAGELAGRCAGEGQRVQRAEVIEVRSYHFGQGSVDDAAVAALVKHRVRAWPERILGRGNAYGAKGYLLAQHLPHAHDGAAVALYAAATGLREAA